MKRGERGYHVRCEKTFLVERKSSRKRKKEEKKGKKDWRGNFTHTFVFHHHRHHKSQTDDDDDEREHTRSTK